MSYLVSFSLGLAVALVTTLLPGLLNMTIAKISLNEGRTKAMTFGLGASVVVFFQAFVATIFGRYIDKQADLNDLIQRIAIVMFLGISVYFFFFATKAKESKEQDIHKNKKGYFFSGMFLSVINLFPIPFYVVLSITLSSYKWFSFDKMFLGMFAIGASTGAMLAFYGYTIFIQKVESKNDFFLKNVNYIIGGITLLMSIVGIIKLI